MTNSDQNAGKPRQDRSGFTPNRAIRIKDRTWHKAQARAALEGETVSAAINRFLELYGDGVPWAEPLPVPPRLLWNVADAAALLGIPEPKLRALIRADRVPYRRVGTGRHASLRFTADDLDTIGGMLEGEETT